MKTNRPRVDVPLQSIDILLDIISATLIILMIVYVATSYGELPDIIPSHFNGKGEIDGHSEKTTLWFLPAISIAMFIGLFILNKYPHMHNYMQNLSNELTIVFSESRLANKCSQPLGPASLSFSSAYLELVPIIGGQHISCERANRIADPLSERSSKKSILFPN